MNAASRFVVATMLNRFRSTGRRFASVSRLAIAITAESDWAVSSRTAERALGEFEVDDLISGPHAGVRQSVGQPRQPVGQPETPIRETPAQDGCGPDPDPTPIPTISSTALFSASGSGPAWFTATIENWRETSYDDVCCECGVDVPAGDGLLPVPYRRPAPVLCQDCVDVFVVEAGEGFNALEEFLGAKRPPAAG